LTRVTPKIMGVVRSTISRGLVKRWFLDMNLLQENGSSLHGVIVERFGVGPGRLRGSTKCNFGEGVLRESALEMYVVIYRA